MSKSFNVMTNCPNCSSNNISLDMKYGKLRCKYCNQLINNKPYIKKWDMSIKEIQDSVPEIKKPNVEVVTLKCYRCGMESIGDKKMIGSPCPWCLTELEKENDEGKTIVNRILPFEISKKDAFYKMSSAINKNPKYITKTFIDGFREENVVGLFIPYPMINAEFSCDFDGFGEKLIEKIGSGDNKKYKAKRYRIKRSFDVKATDIHWEDKDEVINDKITFIDNIVTALYPYDVGDSVPFDKCYLDGFIAESIPKREIRFNDEMNNRLVAVGKSAILDDIEEYNRGVNWKKTDIKLKTCDYNHIYLPVWLYAYTETIDNQTTYYYVAVNGRTGEVIKQIPFDYESVKADSLAKIEAVGFVLLFFSGGFLINILVSAAEVFGSGANLAILLIILLILGITYLVFKTIYKDTINNYKKVFISSNILYENDYDITKEVTINNKVDKEKEEYISSDPVIEGINDNSERDRRWR